MNRRLKAIIIVIVALAVLSELLLPWAAGAFMANGMKQLTAAEDVTVKAVKTPAVSMVNGRFDRVLVNAVNAKIDKFVFNELTLALENVKINMGALLGQRTLVIDSVQNIDLTAVISQEELSRYLNQAVKGVRGAEVTIGGGKVRITSSYLLAGIASMSITLEGRIVGDGHKLKFVTDQFLLNNAGGKNISGSFLAGIPLVDLRKLPFGVEIKAVTMEDGKVTVHADNRPPQ